MKKERLIDLIINRTNPDVTTLVPRTVNGGMRLRLSGVSPIAVSSLKICAMVNSTNSTGYMVGRSITSDIYKKIMASTHA